MDKIDQVTLLASLAQIVGLVVAVVGTGPAANVVIGISGFAAIVNYFLPSKISGKWFRNLKLVAALCGAGMIALALS